MRILFVDDMPDTRDVFRLAFGINGHETHVAGTGFDAIEALRAEAFDAVIMDVEMPGMNGWETVSQMRSLPNGETVPIVMFTAYSGHEDKEKALKAGANDVFQKPMLPGELLRRLEALRSEES